MWLSYLLLLLRFQEIPIIPFGPGAEQGVEIE